ncbi:murein hydrolase activator EnvC family protein [Aliiroseovarius salicola]|uniref:murein hydrolase activator EnvC family protein n=1 Tax=Aliiroseovarius salicola TaxID=3009082 RepID=UPI0038CBFCDC
MARRLLSALLLCVTAGQAMAQAGPAADARAAMISLELAGAALEEAKSARDRVDALTQTVKAYESGLSTLREGLRRASLREATIQSAFDAESDRLAQLLGVLQTIEKAPEPSLLFHPDGPIGTARSGMILSEVAPALQQQAETLRQGLEELATIRTLQEGALDTLQNGLKGAQTARTELSQAIAARTELPRRFVQDKAAMQTLLASSDTLASFASGLLSDPISTASAGTLDDFASAKGRLDLPVLGRILRRYDEADAAGVKRPGWVIATRPLALVSAPWPATIRYLGPLLDYGNVAILEPGDGYLLVLAGLGQLYGEVGEVVAQGSAIGLMSGSALPITSVSPAENSTDQAFLIDLVQGAGAEASETLYIELRENQSPVNPSDWFTAGKE